MRNLVGVGWSWHETAAEDHPAVGELRKAYDVWTPAILPMTERWLSLWQQSGLEPDRAVIAAQASSMAIVGVVDAELSFRRLSLPDDALFTSLPNARLVFSAAHDFDRGFELVVRALISGLHARLSAEAEAEAVGRHRRPRTLRHTS